VRLLRRSLYAYALVSAVGGAALAAFPRSVLVGLFGQVHYPEYAWVRVVGVQALGTAMLAVLVAQRVRDQWWWTWAFVIPVMLLFLVFGVNAVLGPGCASLPGGERECPSSALWWVATAISAALAGGMVVGLARAGREAPPL